MKQLFFIALVLLSEVIFAQVRSFDKGNGNYKDLATAVTALQLIEQNNPGKLTQYFSTNYKHDTLLLNKECEYTSINFPFKEKLFAPCFCDYNGKTLSYERTYYKKTNDKTEYLFQIFIAMEHFNKEIKIVDIQFRHKDKIVKRDEEVKKMNKPVDDNNPPPPPPPFGLPENK